VSSYRADATGMSGDSSDESRFVLRTFRAGLLARVGVYGIVSDSVVQRRREIGIRIALGTQRRNIVMATMQNEMSAVTLRGVVGFVSSVSLARVYADLLYGLHGTDYPSAALAFIVLSCVSLVSSLIPILRVIRASVTHLLVE